MIWVLLIAFQVKHFLADYPLQGSFMLRKFAKNPRTWVPALAAHAGVHAMFTFDIVLWAKWNVPGGVITALCFAAVDFVLHFTMDRIKASPNILGRWQMSSPFFWWSLGFDQMVHHLTHYFIIWSLV